jgi:hypothetical protein
MNGKTIEGHRPTELHASRFAFWIMTLINDDLVLPILRSPYRLLRAWTKAKSERHCSYRY